MAKQPPKAVDELVPTVLFSAKYGNTGTALPLSQLKLAIRCNYFLNDSRALTGKREFRYSHTTAKGVAIFYEVYPKLVWTSVEE